MSKTIIVAGASSGWGHMQAANNINQALSRLEPGWRVESINVFDYFPRGLKLILDDGWRLASKHIDLIYDGLYCRAVSWRCTKQLANVLVRSAARSIARRFEQSDVSVFIATHSMAALVGSLLKPRLGCKLCVAATDFVLHPMQVFPNVDFFYLPPVYRQVSNGRAGLGGLEQKVRLTGIPIAPEFAVRKNKAVLRERFGLSGDLYTILVSFGGTGLRGERHIHLYEQLLSYGLPVQFLVLTGHNQRFAAAMRDRYTGSKYESRIKIHNFLSDVGDFYAAADLYIGKAGGLSISEALAAGLPIVIIDSLPGQETFNIEMISSRHLGHRITNQVDLISLVNSYLCDGLNSSLKTNLDTYARPDSSMSVAKHIFALTA